VASLAARSALENPGAPVSEIRQPAEEEETEEFPNTTQIDPIPLAAPEESSDDDELYSVSGFTV
jgi:hypothetical protein